jgi:hypothetical protein
MSDMATPIDNRERPDGVYTVLEDLTRMRSIKR